MDCNRVSELLMDYLYQELEPSQVGPFRDHLERCPRCAEQLRALQATRAAVAGLPRLEPPRQLSNQLMQAAVAALKDERLSFWQRVREALRFAVSHPAMTAAATLLVVVSISFYAYQRSAPPGPPVETRAPLPEVTRLPAGATEAEGNKLSGEADRSLALKESDGDGTASIAAGHALEQQEKAVYRAAERSAVKRRARRRPRPKPRAGAALRQKGELPLARQAVDEEQAPMDNRRHVGTRGLWKPGRAATSRDKDALGGLLAKKSGRSGGVGSASGAAPNSFDQDDRPAPSVAPAPAKSPPRLADRLDGKQEPGQARRYVALAQKASAAGQCQQALRYYNRALALQPKLKGGVSKEIQRCVAVLGHAGEQELARARKKYPMLAGYLKSELRRVRRAKAQRARKAKKAAKKATKQPVRGPADAYGY